VIREMVRLGLMRWCRQRLFSLDVTWLPEDEGSKFLRNGGEILPNTRRHTPKMLIFTVNDQLETMWKDTAVV